MTLPGDVVESRLVDLVLEGFQRELRALRGGWLSHRLMCEPPSEAIARRFSQTDAGGRVAGSVLAVWRINYTDVVSLPQTFEMPSNRRISGMYFEQGDFHFAIANDLASVVVGWQVGPRFGRGFRYRVLVEDAGALSLKLADRLWIS